MEIERKIKFLESLAGKVSNRRTRRWLNDRLLMELVPRLNAKEIRGLFAPLPWGDDVPPSPFFMTNDREWDNFRTIDMDKASIIESLESSSSKRRGRIDAGKVSVMTAWHKIDCRTREALRRSFLSEWINGYEECLRAFVKESEKEFFFFYMCKTLSIGYYYMAFVSSTTWCRPQSPNRRALNPRR